VIADNVGDNVGDIAGMGSDLFGSFAESTCACLILTTTSTELMKSVGAIYFPLMISAAGIVVCIFTSFISIYWLVRNIYFIL
jgi:Na+/H+-translocating membrane pyrophosphatase